MLSNTEAWLEAEKAVIENELKQLAQDLENSLTNGTSFDYITMQMEHASSLQEEYLTNTNKIYETNKLIAEAQKEIDKTTNTIAKRRLKEFADETQHLQNKSKLSNYELQVQ
jgi:glutamyl-tRNA reductase